MGFEATEDESNHHINLENSIIQNKKRRLDD